MRQQHWFAVVLCLGLGITPLAQAWQSDAFSQTRRWEHISTEMAPARRGEALSALAEEAAALAQANPDVSDVLINQGVILASLARETGGLDALGPAKQARRVLERAIELDPRGRQGSAQVTLGALYARAPGWPVAFGDDETAEAMFQRALELQPQGIAAHYYYAVFLADEGRDAQALEHARQAREGEARASVTAWDETLRERAAALVDELK
ncbi:TRAP transporter TatT component family protein [Halomonas sp. 18H]|uniref:TRAP transporter TatT component family protein n=1 Tax=Halomonas almeriensis TaxID=308163 RepID=UPI002230F115|nr:MULTISPECIES: TRAP transporter TatT component family protein [Halomonas]MCW4149487.1 TRAP transporter TatT component family protein [Halomonas sp. 18H]MDN3553567.1 TRAP transporter TatT component family protein [Halomonas almeriensis]